MRFYILILSILFLSCMPRQKLYYHFFGGNSVVMAYNLEEYPKFIKNTNFDLGHTQDTGRIIKKRNKYELVYKYNIDTLFVYSYEKTIGGCSGYRVDFSNLAVSRNNKLGMKLTQNNLQFNVNGKPLKELINIKNNIVYFNDSILFIETIDSNGIKIRDYLELKYDKTLVFKKLEENEKIDLYFRVSLNGKKIFVYNKFIGTSLYFKKRFKRKKMVYYLK